MRHAGTLHHVVASLAVLVSCALAPAASAQITVGLQRPDETRWTAEIRPGDWSPCPENARPGLKTWRASAPLARDGSSRAEVFAWAYWADLDKDGTAEPGEWTYDVAIANGNLDRAPGETLLGTASLSAWNLEWVREPVTIADGCAWPWRIGRPLDWRPDPAFAAWYFAPMAGAPEPSPAVAAEIVANAPWWDGTANVGAQGSAGVIDGLWAEGVALRLVGDAEGVLAALRWDVVASLRYRRLHYYRCGAAGEALSPWRAADDPKIKIDWFGKPSWPGRAAEGPVFLTATGQPAGQTTAWDPQHCFRFARHVLAWKCTGSMLDRWAAQAGVEAILSDPIASNPAAVAGSLSNLRANGWPAFVLALAARAGIDRAGALGGLDVILQRIEAQRGEGPGGPWLLLNLVAGADHHGMPVAGFQLAVLLKGLRTAAADDTSPLARRARSAYLAGVESLDWAAAHGAPGAPGLWAVDWDPRTAESYSDTLYGGTRTWVAAEEAAACALDARPERVSHLLDYAARAAAMRAHDKNFAPGAAAMVAAVAGWQN